MNKTKTGGDFPYGLQIVPGNNPTAVGSFLYSLGMPVFSGGQRRSIEHDAMMGLVPGGQGQMAGGGVGQPQGPVNFLPNGYGNKQQMRGGMMGLNYRLRR
jgi:hypothetical protein